jgi:PKD repeat protein
MFPTRLFRSNAVPAKPRRAVSPSLRTLSFILIAIIIAALVKQASAAGAWCTAPYVNVAGQGSAPPGGDTTGELQIQKVSIGEPFDGNCSHRSLTVVIKVNSLDPGGTGMTTPPYNTEWEAEFVVPHAMLSPDPGTDQTIFVSWDTEVLPTGFFNFGFVDNSPTGGGLYTSQCTPMLGCGTGNSTTTATGTANPNGTITIKFDFSSTVHFFDINGVDRFTIPAGGLPAPTTLTSTAGHIWVCACAAGSGLLDEVSATLGQNYTTNGNLSCSTPPVAALSAMPTSGNAPLTVNFNASGSNIPAGGCGSISSYIFDFGDATQATQATPTVSHIYTQGGATYPARVRVTSSVGLTSTNNAEQDITVTNVGPPPLVSVASRATHGTAGDFDVNLNIPPATPRGVECRSTGGNYSMVFTFLNNLVSVGSPTVTTGTVGTVSGALGPNSNQYTVTLTGVANQQYIGVTLLAAHDSSGALGNEPAVPMGVLIGDVNATGGVDGNDVSGVQSHTRQPVTGATFRFDVNATGGIDGNDVSLTQGHTRTSLPSAP